MPAKRTHQSGGSAATEAKRGRVASSNIDNFDYNGNKRVTHPMHFDADQYATIAPCDVECDREELDLFEPISVQLEKQYGQFTEHIVAAPKAKTILIDIVGNDDYIQLDQCYLCVRGVFKRKHPTTGALTTVVPTHANSHWRGAVVNSALNSLFSQVNVRVGKNQELANDANTYHPHRAYVTMLMSANKDQQDHVLPAQQLWYPDDPGRGNKNSGIAAVAAGTADYNSGLTTRTKAISDGKTVELCGKIISDLFEQPKFLPAHTPLQIELARANDAFYTISSATGSKEGPGDEGNVVIWLCEFDIESISFYTYDVAISAKHRLADEEMIARVPMSIPLNHVIVSAHRISTGASVFVQSNIFGGTLPQRATFFMANAASSSTIGVATANPFVYDFFGLRNICLTVNGREIPYSSGKDMTPANTQLLYNATLSAMGPLFQNDSAPYLTKEMFNGGYGLMSIALSPDFACGHSAPPLTGSATLKIQFNAATTEDITLFALAEYPAQLMINSLRKCELVMAR